MTAPARGAATRLWRAGAALAGAALAAAAVAQPFEFVALGDMPYGPDLATGAAYRHLIERINDARPAFAIHVGDFKDGVADCTDELYERQFGYFQRFDPALVFTPGDNDWIDCHRTGSDPLERLQVLRARFFAQPRSLGRRPLAVQRQSDTMPAHAAFVENLRWWHHGVLFATFHTVGPDNKGRQTGAALRREHQAREAANAAWIRAAFEQARQRGARAVVLATQGDMLTRDSALATAAAPTRAPAAASTNGDERPWRVRAGYEASIEDTLLPLAAASGVPVLVVHGDSHHHRFDQPFTGTDGHPLARVWRLEVFGEPRMHALRVRIDPDAATPFRIEPIWNALSPDPRR